MKKKKAIITDFDGTLVDTFRANFAAYRDAFAAVGYELDEDEYRQYFGLRFDSFMNAMGVTEDKAVLIRKLKGECYPSHFNELRVNSDLLEKIRDFRRNGGLTAVASTARRLNLLNALKYIGAENDFDLILAGEDVKNGKPDPEIYLTTLSRLNVSAEEAVIYEDSEVGIAAAEAAGVDFVKVII